MFCFDTLQHFLLILLSSFCLLEALNFEMQDLQVADNCPAPAKPGDHLLFEYAFIFGNGTESNANVRAPSQLFHLILEQGDSSDVHVGLKGMCANSTRLLKWPVVQGANFRPLLEVSSAAMLQDDSGLSLEIHMHHITEPRDYAIFDALRSGNNSMFFDLIEEGRGINAIDEWGQTPLMIATQRDLIQMVAGLLNARRPKVDVNIAKSSGYTALVYATQLPTTTIMQALLRKGANPNTAIRQEGSRGNTPLHFACMLEKPKHAELLLSYGASPRAENQFGMTPWELIPRDAVRAVKMHFKKIFEDAYSKLQNTITSGRETSEL